MQNESYSRDVTMRMECQEADSPREVVASLASSGGEAGVASAESAREEGPGVLEDMRPADAL